jgi:nicotinamidase-related amidase
MVTHHHRESVVPQYRRVFVDIDTQADFLNPTGALYVPSAVNLSPALMQLFEAAALARAPIMSAAVCHPPADPDAAAPADPDALPAHCVRGTPGQQKPFETLASTYTVIEPDNARVCGAELFQAYAQVIYHKTSFDFFSNPSAARAVDELLTDEYIVFGLSVERGVRDAVMGLRRRGRNVSIISDAVAGCDPKTTQAAWSEMDRAGARQTSLYEVLHLVRRDLRNDPRAGANQPGRFGS